MDGENRIVLNVGGIRWDWNGKFFNYLFSRTTLTRRSFSRWICRKISCFCLIIAMLNFSQVFISVNSWQTKIPIKLLIARSRVFRVFHFCHFTLRPISCQKLSPADKIHSSGKQNEIISSTCSPLLKYAVVFLRRETRLKLSKNSKIARSRLKWAKNENS